MNGRPHLYAGIATAAIMSLLQQDHLIFVVVAAIFGSMTPDLDIYLLGISRHRNPVFHSCIFPAILFVYCILNGMTYFSSAYAAGVFSHLLLDVKIAAKDTPKTRTKWILGNIIACSPLLLWW